MKDINEKICIIGGGPAGISAAMYLQKKGYQNYTIYEKLNKIGGKSYSPKIEVNGEERTYETGAIGVSETGSPSSTADFAFRSSVMLPTESRSGFSVSTSAAPSRRYRLSCERTRATTSAGEKGFVM